MADNTGIEWTDATWNPVTGCTEVTPGCDHCYAKTFAERWRGTEGHYFENGFDVQLRPDKLDQPLKWKKPRKIFVNSMSDLFHDQVSDDYIANVFAVMARAQHHTFQVLTKRHGRMCSLVSSDLFRRRMYDYLVSIDYEWIRQNRLEWPLRNVWLGVSAEDQKRANLRIPALIDTPAAVRFVSAEPLLGPIDFTEIGPGGWLNTMYPDWNAMTGSPHPLLDWVIVGGESGHGARPMHPRWVRAIRDRCENEGVAFLFKQWGEWGPAEWKPLRLPSESDEQYKQRAEAIGATHAHTGNPLGPGEFHVYKPSHRPWSCERGTLPLDSWHAPIRRWGKKAAGRELDGRTWDQYPEVSHA